MSLRLKLLLLGLFTLVLPWEGCEYAREMESALRDGEQTLAAGGLRRPSPPHSRAAPTCCTARRRRPRIRRRMLHRPRPRPQPAPRPRHRQRQTRHRRRQTHHRRRQTRHRQRQTRSPQQHPLQGPMTSSRWHSPRRRFSTATAEDWPRDPSAWAYFHKDARHRFGILSGVLRAHARTCCSRCTTSIRCSMHREPIRSIRRPSATASGSASMTRRGRSSSCSSPRPVPERSGAPYRDGEYGRAVAVARAAHSRRPGNPCTTAIASNCACRCRCSAARFGVLVDERDARGAVPVSYGTLRTDDLHTLGRADRRGTRHSATTSRSSCSRD